MEGESWEATRHRMIDKKLKGREAPAATHNQYKKLRKEGGTRVLSVGTLVPKDWRLVKVSAVMGKETLTGEAVYLRIERIV